MSDESIPRSYYDQLANLLLITNLYQLEKRKRNIL